MDCRTLFASTSQGKTSTSTGAGSFPEWECCPRPGKVQDRDASMTFSTRTGFCRSATRATNIRLPDYATKQRYEYGIQ